MAADKRLSAALSATEDVTDSLGDIAESALGAATNFEYLDESAESAADSLDDIADEADDAGESLTGITDNAATAAAGLEASGQAADSAGDEFSETTREAAGLSTAMAAVSGTSLGTMSAGVDVPDDVDAPDVDMPDAGSMPMPDGGMVDIGASMPDTSGLDFGGERALNLNVDGADELSAVGGAGHIAAEGLDAFDSASVSAATSSALAAEGADEAGDSMLSAVPGSEAMSSALDSVRDSAAGVIPSLNRAEDQTEELGDTSSRTAAQLGGLSAAMGGTSAASSNLGTSMFGLHGSLGAVLTILPAIVAAGGSLLGVFGGLTVAAGGLAGVVGGGLLASFEQLGATAAERSEEAETSWEGLEIVMSNVKDMAAEALQPLADSPAFDGLALDVIEGFLTLLGDAADVAANLAPEVMATVDAISASWWDNEPEFFQALSSVTLTLLPHLENIGVWLGENIPEGMAWMGDQADALTGDLGSLTLSTLDLIVGLAELGGTFLSLVAPAFSFVADTVTPLLDTFTSLPGNMQQAIVAAGAAAAAFTVMGGAAGVAAAATGLLAGVVGVLTSPITLTIAAVAGLLTYFNAWDDVVNILTGSLGKAVGAFAAVAGAAAALTSLGGITGTLGALSGLISGALIPSLYGMATAAWASLGPYGMIAGAIAGVITYFGWWDDIMNVVAGTLEWITGLIEGFLNTIHRWGKGLREEIQKTVDQIPKEKREQFIAAAEESDIINPDALREGGPGSGAGTGDDSPSSPTTPSSPGSNQQPPPSTAPFGSDQQSPPPAQPSGGATYQDNSVNVDVGSITQPESESTTAQIERTVERQLERNSTVRDEQRQRKRNYPST